MMDGAVKIQGPSRAELPRLVVADGTLQALKWAALALMTLDHINKYLLHDKVHVMFAMGRLAAPLFAFVLAFNLARPGALQAGAYGRTAVRLALFSALASVPYIGLGGLAWGCWPLNFMATLGVSTGVLYLIDKGGPARLFLAALLFLLGGANVEFWWPAIGMTVAIWFYVRQPSWPALMAWVACTAVLSGIPALLSAANFDQWALAALPVVFLTTRMCVSLPRWRWVFYAYYPAHLALLWALQHLSGVHT